MENSIHQSQMELLWDKNQIDLLGIKHWIETIFTKNIQYYYGTMFGFIILENSTFPNFHEKIRKIFAENLENSRTIL